MKHTPLLQQLFTLKVRQSLKIPRQKPVYNQNTGDTIVRQAIIPGKNFCYPCTLSLQGYCLPTGIVAGNERGGAARV